MRFLRFGHLDLSVSLGWLAPFPWLSGPCFHFIKGKYHGSQALGWEWFGTNHNLVGSHFGKCRLIAVFKTGCQEEEGPNGHYGANEEKKPSKV